MISEITLTYFFESKTIVIRHIIKKDLPSKYPYFYNLLYTMINMNQTTNQILSVKSQWNTISHPHWNQFKLSGLNKYDEIRVLVERFLSTKRTENTKRAYRYDLLDYFDYACIIYINDIITYTVSDIQESIYQYLDKQKKYEGNIVGHNSWDRDRTIINSKTINRKAYAISSFFDYLVKIFDYKQNPLCLYQPLREMKNSNTESLDRWELIQILEYSKSIIKKSTIPKKRLVALRNYLLLCFLSMSLRRSEVVRIRWEHIKDIQGVRCVVVRQKWWTYKTLPITGKMMQFLNAYKQLLLKCNWWLQHTYALEGYVFTKHYNSGSFINDNEWEQRPLSTNYIYTLVKRICKKLHIYKKITPHSFRKSFIEIALNNNQNFINICNSTGHSDINLIRYYDTRDSVKNNAVNSVLDGLI